jgi:predicted transcriptional regulator
MEQRVGGACRRAVSAWLDARTAQELERLAAASDRTLSREAARALRQYVERERASREAA